MFEFTVYNFSKCGDFERGDPILRIGIDPWAGILVGRIVGTC